MPIYVRDELLAENASRRWKSGASALIKDFSDSLNVQDADDTASSSVPEAASSPMASPTPAPVVSPQPIETPAPTTAPTPAAFDPERDLPSVDALTQSWRPQEAPAPAPAPTPAPTGPMATPAATEPDSWPPSMDALAGAWQPLLPNPTPAATQPASGTPAAMPTSNRPGLRADDVTFVDGRQDPTIPRATREGVPVTFVGGRTEQDAQRIAAAGTRASRYANEVAQVAREEGVPSDVLAAILDTEDSDELSVSVDGARGLMQVVPGQGFDLPGEDASDPRTSIRQAARALREKHRMAEGDWRRAGGLYFGVGVDSNGTDSGTYQQIFDQNRARYHDATPPVGQAPAPAPVQGIAPGANWRKTWGDNLTPDQIQETLALGLDWDSAIATCGIAAAIAFDRANGDGQEMTFGQALRLAEEMKEWNADVGMRGGFQGQLRLLKKLGVEAHAGPLDEAKIAQTIQAGNPVQINATGSGGHYYVAVGFDPETGRFDFGNSAAILKRANGRRWFRLDELADLGVGSPTNAIYLGAEGR